MHKMMSGRYISIIVAIAVFVGIPGCTAASQAPDAENGDGAQNEDSPGDEPQTHEVGTDIVVENLQRPWAIEFLPPPNDHLALVTEREGYLNLVDLEEGASSRISGLPEIETPQRAGLLDVVLHPEFGEGTRWVYLTYVTEGDGGYALTVGRGRLNDEQTRLESFERLFVATPYDTGNHYGGRMVFDEDGYLYVTSGDRQAPHSLQENHPSQDLSSYHGKTLRLNADGSIPASNPFVNDEDAGDAIFTYGHRNPQGMAVHPDEGVIWQNEHGEQDGDEINVLDIHGEAAGSNYGWPVATYAVDYGDASEIGDLPPERPDTVAPVHWWEHGEDGGFPPSGLAFVTGEAFSAWEGDILMGNLADQYLGRFEIDGEDVLEEHRLLEDRGWRVRAVDVHPSTGEIYALVDSDAAPLVRLYPQ